MREDYIISLENGADLRIGGSQFGYTLSIPKDKLAIGYREELVVISLNKDEIKEIRDCLNKILVNEGGNK